MFTKKIKILTITAFLIIVTIIGIFFLLHAYLPAVLSKNIEKEVKSLLKHDSLDLYDFSIKDIEYSRFFMTLWISEIILTPKENVINKIEAAGLPINIFKIQIHSIKTSTMPLILIALGRKNVDIKLFYAKEMDIRLFVNKENISEKKPKKKNFIESINIQNITIDKIKYSQGLLFDTSNFVLNAENFEFKGLLEFFDSNNVNKLVFKHIEHSLSKIDIYLTNSHYSLKIDKILAENNAETIEISRLKVIPKYDKQEFQKHIKFQTDRIEMKIENTEFRGFDINLALNKSIFVLEQINLNSFELETFRDKNLPFDMERRPHLPVGLIYSVPIDFYIGKINLNESNIIYSELEEGKNTTGKIPFNKMEAGISNLTNFADSLLINNMLNIKAKATTFGNAQLTAEFNYNLNDKNGGYNAKGSLSEFDLISINEFLYPIAGVRVKEGIHKQSIFHFKGNDFKSTGELKMYWSGLLLELVPDRSKFYQEIRRFTDKNLIYFQSNVKGDEKFRTGEINFERDIKRFVFNYWWKSYLSGIQNSLLRDLVK